MRNRVIDVKERQAEELLEKIEMQKMMQEC